MGWPTTEDHAAAVRGIVNLGRRSGDDTYNLKSVGDARDIAQAALAALTFPELMGVREVADALGVSTSNIGKLANMPEPVARLASGSVYLAADVLELREARKRWKEQHSTAAPRAAR